MRPLILTTLALLSAPAFADPCQVTVVRAPDAVRASIEQWVAAEPSCSTTAEVRVVETDGGFYLIAIDGTGRVHERVAPDAQSAGVLVASWIASDVPAPPPPADVDDPAPFPAAPPTVAPVAPPSLAPTTVVVVAPRPSHSWRTLEIAATEGINGIHPFGVRAELDLAHRGRWTFGPQVSVEHYRYVDPFGVDTIDSFGVTTLAVAAHTSRRGPWSLRLAGGLGIGSYIDPQMSTLVSGVDGELSAEAAHAFGSHWAITAGPLLEVSKGNGGSIGSHVIAFAGLRHTI